MNKNSSQVAPHRTVIDLLIRAEAFLRASGITATPHLDAEVLLADLLHIERARLIASYPDAVEPAIAEEYFSRITRRSRGEPVAYITGKKEFMGLAFLVDSRVLIPRPETETLVEYVLEMAGRREIRRVLDIGAGSGCIAVSLAFFLPAIRAYATDVSPGALELSRHNAARHGVLQRVELCLGPYYSALPDTLRASFDVIASNPPYIPDFEYPLLQKNVREYEPEEALRGGPDGLEHFRRIAGDACEWLAPGGILAVEMGEGQAAPAAKLLEETERLDVLEIICDLAGKQRVIVGRKTL